MSKILLIGKPNSGKSLLFNQLTGLKQKVANFPGVTVELKSGRFGKHELIDFPGTYSLNSVSEDELIAVTQLQRAMDEADTGLIICNLDATRLERSLVFALQVQKLAADKQKAVVFALNVVDELTRFGHHIDTERLSKQLGSPVFALSAKTLEGISEFIDALHRILDKPSAHRIVNTEINQMDASQASVFLAKEHAIGSDIVLRRQNSLDSFLLHSIFGAVLFLLIMFVLFQSIFTWAAPLMDATEIFIASVANTVGQWLPEGAVKDFSDDAIFGGLGAFLVFVPQIMVLTFIIGLLEDSGYLARAALICHKPLSIFGLSGRSFIPYLSGHACAIPAIMAARTIESPRKRLITMLTVPLMSCSARLPVYALLIAVLIPQQSYMGGIISLQGSVFFLLYFGGIVTALIVSGVLQRWTAQQDQQDMPFILELPSYRLPHWRPLIQRVFNAGWQFIKRAGPVIFMVSLVIWTLGYFPANGDLSESYLATIGHWFEPLFAPLGIDWRYAVAILLSFLAREVFVGVLGTLFNMENADDNIVGLAERLQADGLSLASGVALLAFYVIAMQCVATVAMLKAETGKNRFSWGIMAAYGILAYLVALACYTLIV